VSPFPSTDIQARTGATPYRLTRYGLCGHNGRRSHDGHAKEFSRRDGRARARGMAVIPWWLGPLWGLLGALVGPGLSRLTHASLTVPRRDHPLTTAVTVSSVTAVLFGLLAWRVGLRPELLAYSALAAVCVPLAVIDLVENRMPARLLLPAYPSLAVFFGLAAIVEHNGAAMLRSCAGMAILFTFYLLIALTAHGALGAADVRLAGLLGLALAWRSWDTFLCGAVLGLFYGALTGITMILLRRVTRHTLIPLGPALIAGAFTALLAPIR
jgi:leader peptidase (prepilin peptidase) / N-methyltransferase